MGEKRAAQGCEEMEKEHYTLMITMPENPVYDERGRWQPTKITAREGWREITVWMRIVYIGFVVGMLCYNVYHLYILPGNMQLSTWFGLSSIRMPTIVYMIASMAVLLYLIYRDLIRRSISRYRLFVPLAALVMNTYFVGSCIVG